MNTHPVLADLDRAPALRRPDVDCDSAVVTDFPIHGSSAHRISPVRVVQMLGMLVKES